VLATITDKKLQVSLNTSSTAYFEADVQTVQDYYAFGMQMPGRKLSGGYRYGFNGKENDNEVKGEGNQQDYGMRIYDGRIGKFLSVGPLTKQYPWYTPYQFAGNKPIWATDLDGLEENTTSTYVSHIKPVGPTRSIYRGIISITDATTQSAHKTFEGDYIQLRKAEGLGGYASSVVNSLVGSRQGAGSKLDITMTGIRSQVSKSWKGADLKYFTQFSYSFTSNSIVEKGTFELQSGQIQVSSRVWDPASFLLLNKVVNSIVYSAVKAGGPAASQEMVTLYRSISKGEAESIQATKKLSFGKGQMEVKQFWETREGLEKFNRSGFGGEFNLEVIIPKSLLGNGKALNTATQVDEFFGPTATIDGAAELKAVNGNIQTLKITPIKK
jgi:RHS repeat-associated protein